MPSSDLAAGDTIPYFDRRSPPAAAPRIVFKYSTGEFLNASDNYSVFERVLDQESLSLTRPVPFVNPVMESDYDANIAFEDAKRDAANADPSVGDGNGLSTLELSIREKRNADPSLNRCTVFEDFGPKRLWSDERPAGKEFLFEAVRKSETVVPLETIVYDMRSCNSQSSLKFNVRNQFTLMSAREITDVPKFIWAAKKFDENTLPMKLNPAVQAMIDAAASLRDDLMDSLLTSLKDDAEKIMEAFGRRIDLALEEAFPAPFGILIPAFGNLLKGELKKFTVPTKTLPEELASVLPGDYREDVKEPLMWTFLDALKEVLKGELVSLLTKETEDLKEKVLKTEQKIVDINNARIKFSKKKHLGPERVVDEKELDRQFAAAVRDGTANEVGQGDIAKKAKVVFGGDASKIFVVAGMESDDKICCLSGRGYCRFPQVLMQAFSIPVTRDPNELPSEKARWHDDSEVKVDDEFKLDHPWRLTGRQNKRNVKFAPAKTVLEWISVDCDHEETTARPIVFSDTPTVSILIKSPGEQVRRNPKSPCLLAWKLDAAPNSIVGRGKVVGLKEENGVKLAVFRMVLKGSDKELPTVTMMLESLRKGVMKA